MAQGKGMRDVTLVMDGVNEQRIEASGDFVHVQAAPTGPVQISADTGPYFTRYQGQGNRIYYGQLSVKSAVAQTITLQVGYGYATDARASFAGVVNVTDAPAVNNPAQASVACAAGVQTQIAAADANALEQLIEIPSNAAGGLWIGGNTAANGVGLFVEPGMVVGIPTTAALFAFNANAVAVTVTRLTLRSV